MGSIQCASSRNIRIGACLAIPTFPVWSGRAHGLWDIESFYYAAWSLLADAAREGHLLLWNLWVSGGRPELADPQVGSLSPPMPHWNPAHAVTLPETLEAEWESLAAARTKAA